MDLNRGKDLNIKTADVGRNTITGEREREREREREAESC